MKKVKKIHPTNWYVITGGPCSGKTTVINLLKERGFETTIEHARHYLDTKRMEGKTIFEIRENERKFQLGVLAMQIEQESVLDKDEIVFLDRAIPDALAYYRFLNLEVGSILKKALKKVNYKKIFILDKLPLVNDYARLEDENDQLALQNLITEVYQSLPFPVVFVPVMKPEERVEFILENL